MPLATLAQTSRDTSLAPAPILTPLPGRLWTFLNSSNSIFLHIYSLVADPSKTCRKQSRNGRFMRDLAQEHSGTCTQSLSTRRKIISSVRPRHIIKRRWRSCTQTAVKHKPLRIGRTCARMGEISSASVDSQSDVFVRKERVWRKH